MFLILAEATDQVAAATTRHLCVGETVWITPAQAAAATWTHRLEGREVSTRLSFGTLSVDLRNAGAVLNRLRGLPVLRFTRSKDIQYAAMEWQALAISALASLGSRVVNPPVPPDLSGPSPSALEVMRLAHGLGLPVQGVRVTTDGRRHRVLRWQPSAWHRWLRPDDVGEEEQAWAAAVPVGPRPTVWRQPIEGVRQSWIVGDRVLGGQPGDPDLVPLARALNCDLLEVTLGKGVAGTVVIGAKSFPDNVSEQVAMALAGLLATRAQS